MTSPAPLVAVIDTDALENNVRVLQARVPDKQLIAVVKADAYGHGMKCAVPAFLRAGVTTFGTATIPEALAVRDLLDDVATDTTVMCWLYEPHTDLSEAVSRGLELGLGSPAEIGRAHV